MAKTAKTTYEIRDPVHGTIAFTRAEKTIIDHPYVQRLRYIRQLGFVFFVYPGATHDRFSHALGTMHLAGRLWDQIVFSSRKLLLQYITSSDITYLKKTLRLAGLLHDSGHGPFSHTSENLLPKLQELDIPREWYKTSILKTEQATHEDFSVMVVFSLAKISRSSITMAEAQDIASLIHHRIRPSRQWEKRFGKAKQKLFHVHDMVKNLISGELDCDRMDYLMRDAHHTGVPYGFYDIDRLIQTLSLAVIPKNREVRITLDYTGIRSFEDFLLARYHMLLQVYFHKTANCFDYFLEQAFQQGEISYAIPSSMKEFAELRDSTIFEKLFEAAKNPNGKWSRWLVSRRPATLVFSSSMLRQDRKKERDKKFILQAIQAVCARKKVVPIVISSAQRLYHSPESQHDHRSQLFVVKRVMGEYFYEPIWKYSNLLQKYNEEINVVDVYVLKEDYSKMERTLKQMLTM